MDNNLHGLIIAAAVLLTILCAWALRSRQRVDNSAFFPTVLCAVVLGMILSRAVYAYFFPEPFRNDAMLLLRLTSGGYSLLGGMVGAFVAIAVMSRLFSFDFLVMLDAVAPAAALGIAVGRMADFFTGENIGITITDERYQKLPFAVYSEQSGAWSLAVMIFAAAACLVVFLLLLALFGRTYANRSGLCRKGDVTLGFLLLFGMAQTVLESMRIDALYFNSLGFVKVMQIAAILMAAVTMIIMSIRSVRVYRKPRWWHYLYWGMMLCCLAAAMWAEFRMSVGTMTRNYTVMISGLLVTTACTVIMYAISTDASCAQK